MATKKVFESRITKEFYMYLQEELAKNVRNAHSLINEVVPLIPEARERQIYQMLMPFAQARCLPQLNFVT